jgi:YggT family protein
MIGLIHFLINLYIWIVIIRVILSWFNVNPYHPVVKFMVEITEPVLSKIREVIPSFGGLDLSPLILILALSLLSRII